MSYNNLEEKSPAPSHFQDLSSILVTPTALNEQHNVSTEEDHNSNILEDVVKEDEVSN